MAPWIPEPDREPLPPSLGEGSWVNTDRPLGPSDLEGTPAAVVRWRASDLPSVAAALAVQAVAGNRSVPILGLHVPGHPREREATPVLHAVLREGLFAPVRQDPRGRLAAQLGLVRDGQAAILDPEGRIAARLDPDELARLGKQLDALGAGEGSPTSPLDVRGAAPAPTELLYPQGLTVHDEILWIADTGHHRILKLPATGPVELAVGAGRPGDRDGPAERAQLSMPRGVAAVGGRILVADSGNGAVRSIDPDSGRVDTLARPEHLLQPRDRAAPGGPIPWDIAAAPGDGDGAEAAVVTLAGTDALARVALDDRRPERVGTPARAFASPTGIARVGGRLVVADAARGALRTLDADGRVWTVLEGRPLAHPVALAAIPGREMVVVADPYVDGLLRVSLEDGTFAPVRLDAGDPPVAGLHAVAASGGKLWTAGDGHRLHRLPVDGGTARVRSVEPATSDVDTHLVLDPVEVAPGGRLVVRLVAHTASLDRWNAQDPRLRGPLAPRRTRGPTAEADALGCSVAGTVHASGPLEIRWRLAGSNDAHVAFWRFPVVQRPDASDEVTVELSTKAPA